MPEIVGFVGASNEDRSKNFDAQRCINMYPQVSSSGTSKTPAKLMSAPGLKVWADMRNTVVAGIRGMIKFNEATLFIVAGTEVFRADVDGVTAHIGSVDSLNTPVSMASNGIQVMAVTGPNGYIIDPVLNTVVAYVDPSFVGADAVCFEAGSFVFNEYNAPRFWATNQYSTIIDPLWFATAEGSPDALVTLAVNLQEVWLFGTETTEVWANSGGTDFPYARVPGVVIDQGCAAKNSVVRLDGSLIWLSANDRGQGQVFQTSGFIPGRISTHSLEEKIADYAKIDDAVAYAYQQEGHSFYVISFPSQNVTWAYDTITSTWSQRAYLEQSGTFSRHRSDCQAFFSRSNLVGDWNNAIVYEMSTAYYSDNGNPLVRVRAAPHVASGFQKIGHNNIQFDIETGVGLPVGQGSDPQLKLRWSDDNGHSFSNQRTASIGKIGEYRKRVRFLRLGQSRDRVYEISFSDPVPFTLLGAHLNAEQ